MNTDYYAVAAAVVNWSCKAQLGTWVCSQANDVICTDLYDY